MSLSSNYKIYSTSKDAWDAMYQAISSAQKSIYWELYIFLDDEAGNPFFDLLEQKAKAGVDVKIVVDSLGSFWLSNRRIKRLREAGVDFRFFYERKKRYRGWWKRLWSRTHRKILIIDQTIGFIGGVNVGKEMKDWLDIHVRLEGNVVHSLLRAFAKSYIICGGEKKNVRRFLKHKLFFSRGDGELILDEPHARHSSARERYTKALSLARRRVIFFSPYYFPDKKFLLALWHARKRGVRVDLLIPFRTDVKIMALVTYTWFSLLRKAGVKVHLIDQMLHGKGVIVDDDWAMVGSSNLEHTSFYDNYEANLKIEDKAAIKFIKDVVESWIMKSKHLYDNPSIKYSFWQRFQQRVAVKLYRLWHGEK
ncbi:MAG: phosphatidylserine/phosphatidylglycerophosphate/cardiolipin synthase family protein [Candidatus Magasanikbacteria bacterium]|nr:phosphatidylserine/phosphatidylglycerophosphate/cardiolipin synthase family protein [Candidatus Magasanikbacteria bacterium]